MRLLVGLGNPGPEYDHTRHNIGFEIVDLLAKKLDATWKAQKGSLIAEVRLGGEKHLLCKPQQFMNRSGEPIRQLVDYYQIAISDVCIVTDDVYITPGSARIRQGGGDGGHNGWKSIHEHLPATEFWRVRVGMGLYEQHPELRTHQPPLDDYVLKPLPSHDQKSVASLIDKLLPNLIQWLELGSLQEETLHI